MKEFPGKDQTTQFPWDRIKPHKLLKAILMPIVWALLRLLFSVQVTGRENLPKKSAGVIITCNHLHSIDPAFLAAFSRLSWRFMAKAELFHNSAAAFLLRHANAFPVERDIVDRKALDFALAVMDACGQNDRYPGLGIFPEGTRSPDGIPKEGKTGAAVIARKTKADILPCSIYHESKLKFRRKITVRFGEIIPFADLGLGETPNKRQNREATDQIMAAITRLWEMKHD